jgi:hypothetical protein
MVAFEPERADREEHRSARILTEQQVDVPSLGGILN